jgi:hypothetical protein
VGVRFVTAARHGRLILVLSLQRGDRIMRPNSSGAALLPLLNKRVEKSASLSDHHVGALLEATRQDHAHSQAPASEPIEGIWVGVAVGAVLWLLLAGVFLMAWAR